MSYIVNKTNGEILLVLQDAVVDRSTSLQLVGKSSVGYGEYQNENFVFLLENFANSNPPSTPIKGQTWYDSEKNTLNAYTGQAWQPVGRPLFSEQAPSNPLEGTFWFKQSVQSLSMWEGQQWITIGPQGVIGFGETRNNSLTVKDIQGVHRPVILTVVDDTVVAITAREDFTIDVNSTILGFDEIKSGINVSSNSKMYGNLVGVASEAEKLKNGQQINGTVFNGTTNVETEYWGKARSITIGGTTKAVNGIADVFWTVPEVIPQTTLLRIGSLGVGTFASGNIGQIRATGEIVSNFSDDRLKHKLEHIEQAVEKIQQLDCFYYIPNQLAQSLGYEAKKQVGLSAQQVNEVLPEVVAPAPVDDAFLTIQYEKMIPLVIQAIKELSIEVKNLKLQFDK